METVLIALLGAAFAAIISMVGYFYLRLERKIENTNSIVRRELRPNGGESMFDKVDVIEKRLINGSFQMDSLDVRLQNIEHKM